MSKTTRNLPLTSAGHLTGQAMTPFENAEAAAGNSDAKDLFQITGWPWMPREVSSFLIIPKQFSREHKDWRSRLISSFVDSSDVDVELVREAIDGHVAVLREVTRILMTLNKVNINNGKLY